MYKVVVVGTDGSPTADKAVQGAADVARSLGSELHIVTAYRVSAPGLAQASGVALIDSGTTHAILEDASKGVADKAVSDHGGGLQVTTHVMNGDAVDAILDTAAAVNADLIVVGSKGMHRRVLGSVPNSVAHGAPCAVLIVKTG
jgi:nucleotide-binding universal stress UspA family protein